MSYSDGLPVGEIAWIAGDEKIRIGALFAIASGVGDVERAVLADEIIKAHATVLSDKFATFHDQPQTDGHRERSERRGKLSVARYGWKLA